MKQIFRFLTTIGLMILAANINADNHVWAWLGIGVAMLSRMALSYIEHPEQFDIDGHVMTDADDRDTDVVAEQ